MALSSRVLIISILFLLFISCACGKRHQPSPGRLIGQPPQQGRPQAPPDPRQGQPPPGQRPPAGQPLQPQQPVQRPPDGQPQPPPGQIPVQPQAPPGQPQPNQRPPHERPPSWDVRNRGDQGGGMEQRPPESGPAGSLPKDDSAVADENLSDDTNAMPDQPFESLPEGEAILMSEAEMEDKVGEMVYEMLEVKADEKHHHYGGSDSRFKPNRTSFCIILIAISLFHVILL